MNTQSFDDQERNSSNLQNCFLKALFEWISVSAFLHVSSYANLCSLFLVTDLQGVSLVYFLYTWVTPSCTFNEFPLLIKINKRINKLSIVS
jgi:hypothetical protein